MLKTSRSIKYIIRSGKSGVGNSGDGSRIFISRLKTSSSTDLLTSAAQIVVEFDKIDINGSAIGKLVKKLSKSRRIVKKSEKPQRPERLKRSLVWRNVY